MITTSYRLLLSTLIILTVLLNITMSKSQTTSLSYVYKYEIKLTQEVAVVVFEITNKTHFLTNSYRQVDNIVAKITLLVQSYCSRYEINDKECNTTIQTMDEQIDTLYKIVNKKMFFSSFLYKRRLKLNVFKAKQYVAHLIDQIHNVSTHVSMVSFHWLQDKQNHLYQEAIKLGVQEGFRLCDQINAELQSLVRVQQIADFQVEDFYKNSPLQTATLSQEALVEDLQNSNQDENPTIQWKFQVLCKID